MDAVCISTGCADVWGLKALRAGMGAQFRLSVRANMKWEYIREYVQQAGLRVHVADSDGTNYTSVDWTTPSALIIGSEANGVCDEARGLAKEIVGIELDGGVESLNAAMAGGIILFEAKRQRMLAGINGD